MKFNKTIFFILLSFLVSFKGTDQPEGGLLEKIYTQTDRSLYFPGETVWFKSYITNSRGKVSNISEYMNSQLISPKGVVVKELKLIVSQGFAYGDFDLDENWVGGRYKLRMFTNWMRNFGEESFFEKEIIVQKIISPKLLMTLEFDKESYGPDNEVVAHFEVKDLDNTPLSNQKIQLNVQIGGENRTTKYFETNNNGKHDIRFKLPKDLNTTDVLFNVLVPYNKSNESISRSVPVTLNRIDLQFFPESGNAIIGLDNQIAFKAVNEFGKPADISGEIINERGEIKAHFKSFHDGMGSVIFRAKSNQYFARITSPFKSDSLISLPKIQSEGTTFTIKENSDSYTLNIFSNTESQLILTFSTAQSEVFKKRIFLKNEKTVMDVLKKALPTGIIKISLSNPQSKHILAERLLFSNPQNQLKIAVTLDKKQYKTREKVLVKLKTTDLNDHPIPANLSVSVADNKLVSFANDKQDNILSYLLMSSELHGKIYKPSFYFDPEEEKAKKARDFLMLTNGWRKYIEQPITFENARFKADMKGIQSGKIVDKNDKGITSHLLLFDQESNEVFKFNTDDEGNFSFKVNNMSNMVLVAYRDDAKAVKIIRETFIQSSVNNTIENEPVGEKNPVIAPNVKKPLQNNIKEEVKSTARAAVKLSDDSESLDEVVVVGYGVQRRRSLSGAVVTVVDNNSISNLQVDNLGQLLQGRVAGVQVANSSNLYGNRSPILVRGSGSIRGNAQPLIIIDGVPFDLNDADRNVLQNIDPSNIDKVHVLKGAAASALYGSNGVNGVIIVATKNKLNYQFYGTKTIKKRKFKKYAFETFQVKSPKTYVAKQFYAPQYESKRVPEERTDFRNTIYWNPVIQTDENGEASFEYYNSDAISSFVLTAEGVGYNGLIGRGKIKYATNKTLNIDFKVPNYLVLNDTVQVQVTIKNNSDKQVRSILSIELPETLKLVSNQKEIQLDIKPKDNVVKSVTVVPVKTTGTATIKMQVNNGVSKDVIQKELSIITPYFPTGVSISDQKDNSFQFDLNNVVKGSVKAEFSVYLDIVGNVMDGISSMLRQPHGCFEQVSSSTYPNILILKYLKETGKSNPKIEREALAYIKDGYKRLAAYEIDGGGFEWYGRKPAHEALSAYGLMEFTEMKAIYNEVSEPLIRRTIKFLMERKDGHGGFKQNRGLYGFSAAPKIVNNAYIVYAISESGIAADIEKEYELAYIEAVKSKDAYRLALMACTSYNLKKEEKAQQLMNLIQANLSDFGFEKLPVDNTITRSYGASKAIETAAFTVIALLKQGGQDFKVNQGVEFILSKRTYGSFGSTQSTAMALKALIEYAKNQKDKIVESKAVNLEINGRVITRPMTVNDSGKIVIEEIEKYFGRGNQQVKVNFSNSEGTFPYLLEVNWESKLPKSSPECKVSLNTIISNQTYQVGETMRMTISVKNKTNKPLPMTTAIVGIPSGTSAQPWQLKELIDQTKADYFELFDNYLVFYWKELNSSEEKIIQLDLKAEVAGSYIAPPSTVYLYYANEFKHWIKGNQVTIE